MGPGVGVAVVGVAVVEVGSDTSTINMCHKTINAAIDTKAELMKTTVHRKKKILCTNMPLIDLEFV